MIEEGGDILRIEVSSTSAEATFEGKDCMYVTKDGTEGAVVDNVFYDSLDKVPKDFVLYVEYLKVVHREYVNKLDRYN